MMSESRRYVELFDHQATNQDRSNSIKTELFSMEKEKEKGFAIYQYVPEGWQEEVRERG